MTDQPNSSSGEAANAPSPETGLPTGDPELAALVRGSGSPDDADSTPTAVTVDPTVEPTPEAAAVATEPLVAAVVDAKAPAPRRRRSLAFRFGVSFVLGVLLALGIGVGALYAWGQQYQGRILPGVSVGSSQVGGLTRDQAAKRLSDDYSWLGKGELTLTGPDGETATISYADLGRGPDTANLVDAALAAGRKGVPLAELVGAPRAAIHGVTLDSAVAYDHEKLAAAVDRLAATIDQTPVNAAVSAADGGAFNVSAAKNGRAIDKKALLAALDGKLASLDAPASITMAAPVVTLAPAIATASAETAKAAADRMTADVVITRDKDTWTIKGKSLAPLVSFWPAADGSITPVFNQSGLDAMVATLAKQVNRSPKDAGLRLVGGHIVAVGASREGRTLDAAGMKAAIVDAILARQAGGAAAPLAAVVKAVEPKLSTADAKAYAGKMKVISSFSVYYFVIINNHFGGNIEAPATKINGTVVPAGGVFDFWKVVGDLRRLPGAGPGNAIEGGKITVTGAFGGGICTTSTTLFNAAFRAGMIPMARQNHNEFINRYPPGLDATVWIVGGTKQTMSFKNDTQYPILIQRIITHAGNRRWITFKIWSVPNGRTYKITNLVVRHGPRAIDTVVHDPTKPVGYTFRNNAPADGAKVWVTVSIYDHGKLHWTKRYYSNYPAVKGVLIVGTKRS
jgi:vancomycin resistance protein YoaR